MHVKEVISEIRKIARLNPEIVYSRDIFNPGDYPCQYVVDGKGSCIVGRALVNLGIVPERLHEFEGLQANDVLSRLSVGTDHSDQTEWVNRVQSHQDANAPWGIAVEKADRYIEGLTLD